MKQLVLKPGDTVVDFTGKSLPCNGIHDLNTHVYRVLTHQRAMRIDGFVYVLHPGWFTRVIEHFTGTVSLG